eukprot:7368402-Pyramimonas_sp.AAC.1
MHSVEQYFAKEEPRRLPMQQGEAEEGPPGRGGALRRQWNSRRITLHQQDPKAARATLVSPTQG